MAQHVDLFVDRRGFGDVRIADGYVGLWLVVVVVRNEVFDGVFGEKLPQLVAQLCRQRFVVGQHQGRSPGLGDHIGHREGFSGSRCAKQRLVALTAVHPLNQLGNRRGLIPFGRIGSR